MKVIHSILAVIILFLCACGGGGGSNSPPTLTIIEAEHTSSETAAAIISERRDANTAAELILTASENKVEFSPEWVPSFALRDLVKVEPLFDGKPWREKLPDYIDANNRFREIADDAGISGYWRVGCTYVIDKDGIVDTSEIWPFEIVLQMSEGGANIEAKMAPPSYQLLADELLRIINSTQGKWMPAIGHDGEPIKVWVGALFRSGQLP